MKNPTAIVSAALEKVSAAEIEIQQLQTLGTDTKAELTAMELSVDLADAAGLAKIGRLHTLETLIPRRLAARETAHARSLADLQQSCEEFITVTLGPRLRALLERARVKVRAELKPHFPESIQLDRAVESAALITELGNLQSLATIFDHGPDRVKDYAARLLQVWQDAERFEKAKLN